MTTDLKTRRFFVKTLGCKVNQVESESLSRDLEQNGWASADSACGGLDLVIINTCAVTAKAAMQSRQTIRQAIRANPNACIVATGCHVQTQPDQIKAIQGVHFLIGQSDKHRIIEILEAADFAHQKYPVIAPPHVEVRNIWAIDTFFPNRIPVHPGRTRPFLKVQDGCDAFCTYCIVPHARGKSRSMPVSLVLNAVETLHRGGYKEIVLTGIHLGYYGHELEPKTTLFELLQRILDHCPIPRIRLSSIEPGELGRDIVELVRDSMGRICNHFHIPLQSGDDRILKMMNRPYTADAFRKTIDHIHQTIPDCGIGADILVGFPGESLEAFQNTARLIETLPLTYLHAFPFSPRKGTPAERFPERLPSDMLKERLLNIRTMGMDKKKIFFKSLVGKPLEVLVEDRQARISGMLKAMASNYVPVFIEGPDDLKNRIVQVRIDRILQEDDIDKPFLHGIPVDPAL